MNYAFWKKKLGFEKEQSDSFNTIFRHFRRVLVLNNRVLELIADLERLLGGEYVFDQAFLKSSVTEIIEKGRQVIYCLNSMSRDRYSLLYEHFTITGDQLNDLLAGGPGPYGGQMILEGEILHRDLIHLAGGKGSNLGEIKNSLNVPTPSLFVVSVPGYKRFMESNRLFDRINKVFHEVSDPAERAQKIAHLLAGAKMPSDLSRSISKAVKNLRGQTKEITHFAVRSSAVGEDGERTFAGQFHTLLNIPANGVVAACQEIMASRFSERLLHYIDQSAPAEEAPMAVVIQPMISAFSSGVLYTRDPNNPAAEEMVVAAVSGLGESLVSGRESGDRYVASRFHPFTLKASSITAKDLGSNGYSDPTTQGETGMRRGSGVITPSLLKQLVEYGLLLEKHFESPQDIEWCVDSDKRIWILQSRPLRLLRLKEEHSSKHVADKLAQLPVIISNKGHASQLGLACGPVVQVTEETSTIDFPIGAVAVSHYASPLLAGIVQRAAAIVTDIGNPTGHLATITREFGTPALFGVDDATSLLQEGSEVVVDVEDRTVYAGRIDLPPNLAGNNGFEPLVNNPEVRLLRRLLRLIRPLNLVDPDDPAFKMENCRTIHDFLRFCHERAVAELINFHASGRTVSSHGAPLLKADIPLKIRLIDIGDGLLKPHEDPVSRDQIGCRPFLFLLQGLLKEKLWDKEPMPFGIRDFMSGLSKPLDMLSSSNYYSGENVAIMAENYCNLSLRLGYHFNIIDCFLSDKPDENYVYFRFVGGFAEEEKRKRRAALIGHVLAGLHFKVEQKGDLVMGKAKMLERLHLENILVHLGELVAFTRQLDVRMADDMTVDAFFDDFLARIRKEPVSYGS